MSMNDQTELREAPPADLIVDDRVADLPAKVPAHEREQLSRNPNFIWIVIGTTIAMLGAQFTGLALPWLVLKITGDPVALATVMVISGVPQILLLLFGGGLADRYSPKKIMLWSYTACSLLLLGLSTLLFVNRLELWMIDAFAFSTGLVFGLSIPASFSLIASTLPKAMVPAASSAVGSIRQVAAFIGPLLAGALLGIAPDSEATSAAAKAAPDMSMFAIAFLIDGVGLALVGLTMLQVVFKPVAHADARPTSIFNLMPAVRWFIADRQALTVLCYWTLIAFVLSGPVRIALPLLAEQSTGLGAKAYGVLVSANSVGVFLGMTALGLLRAALSRRLWPSILLLDAIAAGLLIVIGMVHPSLAYALFVYIGLLVLVGSRAGFVEIAWFSWLQQRYPDEIRGRATSVFMVISTLNISASVALSGWLSRQMPAKELFMFAGAATLVVVTVGALLRMTGLLKVED